MRKSNLVLIGLAALAGFAVCTPALAAPADLGTVLNHIQIVSAKFALQILVAAKWLAVTLATIDLSLMLIGKLLQGEGPQEIGVAVLMRVMWYGFLTFLMNVGTMAALIDGFRTLGETASGISIVNPADIFFQGVDVVNIFMRKFADNANVGGVPVPAGFAAAANPLVALIIGLVLLLIVGAFATLTAQYIVLLVQMYFFLACSPLVVSFGALKHGRDMTTKTISGAIVMGVKFLAIYFVLFAAQEMATNMGEILKDFSIANLTPMWACFGMAFLLLFMTLKVPQMAADMLSGTVSLSGGDVMATAAVGGGAAAALAGGAASLAGGTANSVGGALKAGSAAIDQAKASGASGLGGIAAGAASALGSAGLSAASDAIKGIGGGSSGGMAERIGSKTAHINEARAAGNPTATVPSSQPPAPVPAGAQGVGPAGTTAPVEPQGSTVEASASTARPDRAMPPAPAPTANSAQPEAPARSISSAALQAIQPKAPSAGNNLANNLVNELKQADSAQAASLNIQTAEHD